MEAIYWMIGPHDGICIFDAPNAIDRVRGRVPRRTDARG